MVLTPSGGNLLQHLLRHLKSSDSTVSDEKRSGEARAIRASDVAFFPVNLQTTEFCSLSPQHAYMYMCVYTYIYVYAYISVYIYLYVCIDR
jgi:hypothetical protein